MWIVIIVLRMRKKIYINIKKRVVLWLHHNSAGVAHEKRKKIKVKKKLLMVARL